MNNCCYLYDKYHVQFQKKKLVKKILLIKKIFKNLNFNSHIRRTPQFRPDFALKKCVLYTQIYGIYYRYKSYVISFLSDSFYTRDVLLCYISGIKFVRHSIYVFGMYWPCCPYYGAQLRPETPTISSDRILTA